jgi:predicted flap endonuclease-1-like 5' DNA nuclease
MAVQEERTQERGGGGGANILDAAMIVLVSPLVIPALVLGLRPVAKTIVKGGLFLTGTVQHLATATSEGWSAWVAEARGTARAEAADLPGAAGTAREGVEAASDQPPPDTTDLQRLTGIGNKYAELLRTAGVASVRVLARCTPPTLHEQLRQVNEQHQIVSQAPSLELVAHWITQAQSEEREPSG